jgi:hypothetical protein
VNDTQELADETIARIVEHALPDHRETLTGGAPENDIDAPIAQAGSDADFAALQTFDRTGDDTAMGKVELVRGAMNGVDFDGRSDIETRLLEPKAHAARTGEQVDSNWPHFAFLPNQWIGTIPEQSTHVDRFGRPEKTSQSLFKLLRILKFALPNLFDRPTNLFQFGYFLAVTLTVSFDLRAPEFELRFGEFSDFAPMAVPEASVYEDRFLATDEYDVRFSWQVFPMKSESITKSV